MPSISEKDIIKYYDLTEGHMRMFWKLDEAMGLHYGIWDKSTKTLADSIVNTNRIMAKTAGIEENDRVLDAGCGVGGSSIYLAKHIGAQCTGITLSAKQVDSARSYAQHNQVADKAQFAVGNYFHTEYADESFDYVWALESMGTAPDKGRFLKEMYRVLKPGGKIVICDWYKAYDYPVDQHRCMQHMLYHWMISDLLTPEEQRELGKKYDFELIAHQDFTKEIKKSVNRIYWLSLVGMLGTKAYQLTHPKVSSYSKNHYKTGLGQYHGYRKGLWEHHLWVFQKPRQAK